LWLGATSSARRPAAVDHEVLAGRERGLVRGEDERRVADLARVGTRFGICSAQRFGCFGACSRVTSCTLAIRWTVALHTAPGQTPFRRMPSSASSSAMQRVISATTALVAL
jgi:hypothetical protein